MRLVMSYYLNLIKVYYYLNIHTIKTKNRNTVYHFSSDLNVNNPENVIVLIYNTKISFLYIQNQNLCNRMILRSAKHFQGDSLSNFFLSNPFKDKQFSDRVMEISLVTFWMPNSISILGINLIIIKVLFNIKGKRLKEKQYAVRF